MKEREREKQNKEDEESKRKGGDGKTARKEEDTMKQERKAKE